MYDPQTGRGYDGLISETQVNYNAGTESTIEATHVLKATRERHPTEDGQAPSSEPARTNIARRMGDLRSVAHPMNSC